MEAVREVESRRPLTMDKWALRVEVLQKMGSILQTVVQWIIASSALVTMYCGGYITLQCKNIK